MIWDIKSAGMFLHASCSENFLTEESSGKFASVHLGAPKGSHDRVAIKVIEKKRAENMATVMREVDILKKVNHPNVVRILAFDETDDNYFLVLELYVLLIV